MGEREGGRVERERAMAFSRLIVQLNTNCSAYQWISLELHDHSTSDVESLEDRSCWWMCFICACMNLCLIQEQHDFSTYCVYALSRNSRTMQRFAEWAVVMQPVYRHLNESEGISIQHLDLHTLHCPAAPSTFRDNIRYVKYRNVL